MSDGRRSEGDGSRSPFRPAVAGGLSALAGLAVGEAVGGVWADTPSLVLSVGAEVVDRVPPWVEDLAIGALGRSDKLVLLVAIVAVTLLIGAMVGDAARRRPWLAPAMAGGFAALGVAAAASRYPDRALPAVLAGALAAAAAVLVFRRLVPPAPAGARAGPDSVPRSGRRRFLSLAGALVATAVVAGAAGRRVGRLLYGGTDPSEVVLSEVARPLSEPATGASLDVEGLSPLFTPNGDFYRIDTALVPPRVEIDEWRLRVTGMVDEPLELTYDDLADQGQVEADVTLACVSNEVGGPLVGNARWQGVPLAELLRRARPQRGATQLVGRSVDDWTAGFPTEVALDGRPALVAVGMNGEPLPVEHGFPARLVVPGLYGYVSATKWLTEIELTTLDAFDAYWVPRGWSKEAPVKIQSRIDVPQAGQSLRSGRRPVAGVAWATGAGISRVEVAVDDGPWMEAELADALADGAWRQWRADWQATPGRHRIRVRATDGDGRLQTALEEPPRPDGASGHHQVAVTVGRG